MLYFTSVTNALIIGIIAIYFALLILVSFLTGRKSDNQTFFLANRSSPWFVVAFGMVGASLSGVTFISVPGAVGDGSYSYMQMVLGYFIGYLIIANVLLPLYYRLKLTSIYTYLEQRFGFWSYKSGAFFFLISRIIGASFRLFLVAKVLDIFVLADLGIPFWLTVLITISLIWVYSFRSGIKTIVWTDTLQTAAMLLALFTSMYFISEEMGWSLTEAVSIPLNSEYGDIFVWELNAKNAFWKHFLAGIFIAVVMTGLDQDMMQKNLSCRTLGDAKKNMISMSLILIVVNFLFLTLGAMLYIYGTSINAIEINLMDASLMEQGCHLTFGEGSEAVCAKKDDLFPLLALKHLPVVVGASFLIGLIAAAYSSADSALTSLTTSFCVDFLGMNEEKGSKRTRYIVHLSFSLILFVVILLFYEINNDSVINELFVAAGYTYGPLLGMYAFGLFSRRKIIDQWVPFICLLSPVICWMLNKNAENWLNGYKFGFELLILNGILTALGLFISSLIRNEKATS